jgi:hypothetical protein
MTAGTAPVAMAIIFLTRGYDSATQAGGHRGMRRRLNNLRRSLRCFRTTSKIVVFESDDWGLDGIVSRRLYDALAAEGLIDTGDRFNRCGRESVEDLEMLYETLAGFSDSAGRPPALTANFVMANPDFEAVSDSGFTRYSWIPIDDATRAPREAGLLGKYQEGLRRGLFRPQYHGRDHIGAESWLQALQRGDPRAHAGLRHGVPMSSHSRFLENEYTENDGGRMTPLPRGAIREKVHEGMALFDRVFGMPSLTSIAPAYLWSEDVEWALRQEGVRCMQAGSHQLLPCVDGPSPIDVRHELGEQGSTGVAYLVRNCQFEPSRDGEPAVGECLSAIGFAFARGLPAIIDSHRVNYVGAVDPASRDRNLRSLRDLIQGILRCFPAVRFATSDQLAGPLLARDGEAARDAQAEPLMPAASLPSRVLYVASERLYWWKQPEGC